MHPSTSEILKPPFTLNPVNPETHQKTLKPAQICLTLYPDGAEYAGGDPLVLSHGILSHDAGVAGRAELGTALRRARAPPASSRPHSLPAAAAATGRGPLAAMIVQRDATRTLLLTSSLPLFPTNTHTYAPLRRCRYMNSSSNAWLRLAVDRDVDVEALVSLAQEGVGGGGSSLDPGPLVARGHPLAVRVSAPLWVINSTHLPISAGAALAATQGPPSRLAPLAAPLRQPRHSNPSPALFLSAFILAT
jgi:hypothetical protein